MPFDLTDNVNAERDDQGNVQHLEHFQQPFVGVGVGMEADALNDAGIPFAPATTPQALAAQYLQEVAPLYGIDETMLPSSDEDAGLAADDAGDGAPAGSKLELTEEKDLMGTTTIAYQQTYNGLPVWEAGVSVTLLPNPLRVTASQSTVHNDVALPEADALDGGPSFGPEAITPTTLKQLLGLTKGKPTINGTRQLVYRYEPDRRIDPAALVTSTDALEGGPPTLPLPPVPDTITANEHYVVTEVLFTLAVEGFGEVNWRAFIEVHTGAVLYLRAFIACAAAMIFRTDPVTAGGNGVLPPTAGAAALNPFRTTTTLEGLTAGNPQGLSGQFVRLVDNDPPMIAPPTQTNPPANFFYNATSREFAAVNAYHHCDWLFRLMQGMGFNLGSYFDGTTFPVPVDPCAFSDARNARAPGNAAGIGSNGFQFGLAGTPFPSVGIAADVRVVLHEFGHALLWDSVHSPNFGFAHSAGDSLASILLDPESALWADPVRRFETFPWILPNRNHGRDVAAGWAWDGPNYAPFVLGGVDQAGYLAEQILSTTLFRVYRSLGGDSVDLNRRKLASRQAAYLIFRAIGQLATNPVTTTRRPEVYVTALTNADIGTANFEGYRGGTFHKVMRWSFERQGLFQRPGTPRPIMAAGAPPNVDVYVNDGRNGEYPYLATHWECTDIWNRRRRSILGGGGLHQTPMVGLTNYAYVRVRNRGTQPATNVVVRGYSANPGAGLSWPGDWTPMDTPQIAVPAPIAPGASVLVGPFRWTPRFVGHECMFMEVSADGDLSNIDPRTFFPCATGPTPEWRLVPFDNNLGQRNVVPVPGAGGLRGLLSSFLDRRFLVRNPLDAQARIEVKAELPTLLAQRGWRIRADLRLDGTAFGLAPSAGKEVTLTLDPGEEFSVEQLNQVQGGAAIRVLVYADGMVIGGMTYLLDPTLRLAPVERRGGQPILLDNPAIEAAIRDAQLLRDEAGMSLVADDTGGGASDVPQEEEDQEDDEDPIVVAAGGAFDTTAAAARQLLSQLGIPAETVGKVGRVKLRKITLDIEIED